MIIEETNTIRNDSSVARRFGITLGVVLFFWGWVFTHHGNKIGHNVFAAGYIFVLLALLVPIVLRPLHKIWSIMGVVAGFIFTGIILAGFFYLIITPISLLARLSGKKFMKRDFTKKADSYWQKKEVIDIDKDGYKKQY